MPILPLRNLVHDDFDAVNALIIERIQSEISLIDDLSHHIVESGGKRLRPLIVLLASRACGYEGRAHIALAAMIEFFHTATLLHDDVVDESTLRRGRETANEIWGSKASVLVGDYLFTQHVQLLVEVGNLNIMRLMADTAFQISCGEVKQLSNRHNPRLSRDDYFDQIRSKTSLLFAASSCVGAHIAGSEKAIEKGLYDYGLHLGNAFQLIDDVFDYCSDSQTLGKNIGDDLADGKMTLPLLHAFAHGTDKHKACIDASIQQGSLAHMDEILQALTETGAIAYTQNQAAKEIDAAISALTVLPDSAYKKALIDLADYAISRDH